MAAANGQAPPPPRSFVCVAGCPPFTVDDNDGTLEWFVPELGRGARRAVRAGDHLAPSHALVLAHPGFFQPSAEPPDCWPVSLPDDETRERRQAEQMRLASHPARHVRPCCARCGQESEHAVIMFDKPGVLDLVNALSALDDGDPESWAERQRIEARIGALARVAQEQEHELTSIEAAWRADHGQCPEGTPPMPEPDASFNVDLFYRLPGIRSAG